MKFALKYIFRIAVAIAVLKHVQNRVLDESPSLITNMNCTSRWTSGIPQLDEEFIMAMVLGGLSESEKKHNCTEFHIYTWSSRCPSGCAIHCGYRALTFT